MESHEYEMVLQTIYRTHDSDEAHDSLTLVNLLGIIHVVGYGLQASDPRDHIFGVLNMAADIESLGLVPDYTQSCEKVFIEAVTALIKKGEIVILGWANAFGSGPPSIESTVSKLPLWVLDWRLPISSSIGAFTQFFTTESPWDLRDTVWRVPVGDIELTAEGEYKRASHAFKNGYLLLHDRFKRPDTTKCLTNEEKLLTSRFWEIMDAQSLERRYFITKKGYIGLGPEALAPGDLAVVFLALNIPLILRLVEEGHYRIVREVYVNDIIDGQAFEGDYKLREFLID
ncbi:MAG: hypothetical protein LQ337_008829 [Flavoplaca oasis]|nr:MAG: hypothetical protein LQ337_008829 [Flavoplaca oasis]